MNNVVRNIMGYPTDTPLKFWLKYWEYQTRELCDLDCIDMQLNNPHFLLKEIISEIEYNDFKNKENRSLFRNLLNNVLNFDAAFIELYKKETNIVLKNWDISPLLVKTLCNNILRSMDKYDYLNLIVKKLQSVLDDNDVLDKAVKNEICIYTDMLIQELICLGIDIEDISTFVDNDDLLISEQGKVIACKDSFFELRREDYDSEEDYYEAVSSRSKNRIAKDYIDNILNHFYKEAKDGFVILRLIGVKGSISYYFQDVHLYSIDKTTYLPKESLNEIEKDDSDKYVNVAVRVKHRFLNTTINYAIQRVESLLDYLSFNISNKKKLSISKQFAAIVVDGQICGSHHSIEDDANHMRQYRDLMAFDLTPYGDDINNWLKEFTEKSDISNNTFKKISKSTHWYRKAKCATKFEDKLLYSWIALESVLKVSDSYMNNILPKCKGILEFAKTICSSVMTRNKFYSYAGNIYLYLINNTQNYDNYYDFKQETIEKARLNLPVGDTIELSYFFNELPSLIKEMNDEVFKQELVKLQSFYENKKSVNDYKIFIENDVILIYRLRNMIAHNAICPEYIIKLYANKAQFIVGSLIQALRYYYKKGFDIENALLEIYSQYQIFESNVDMEIKKIKGISVI
jgi:hypothetical protein